MALFFSRMLTAWPGHLATVLFKPHISGQNRERTINNIQARPTHSGSSDRVDCEASAFF
jgi:hypothetical protein